MPTYEFRCPTGHEFEKFYRSIGAAPTEVPCPTCGKLAERLMSAGAGLVFKGSGFYITDYGKDGKKSQPTRPSETSTGSTEGGGVKNEASPPAAKPSGEQRAPASKSEDSKSSAPKSEAPKSSGKNKGGE